MSYSAHPVIILMDLIFCQLHALLAGLWNMLAVLNTPGWRSHKGSIWLSDTSCFQGQVWIKPDHLGQLQWNLHACLLFYAVISAQHHLTPLQWHCPTRNTLCYYLFWCCWWIKFLYYKFLVVFSKLWMILRCSCITPLISLCISFANMLCQW